MSIKFPPARQGGIDGGAQRVIIATLRAWIGFRLNPNGKYRLKQHWHSECPVRKIRYVADDHLVHFEGWVQFPRRRT